MGISRKDQVEIRMRIEIEQPVAGVLHSLQEDDRPLDPKSSKSGEALRFEFPARVAFPPDKPPRFFGKQVRAEGKVRQFVYIRIGTSAGECLSPWSRRMKIDIHDIAPALLEKAAAGAMLVGTINGTGKDGTPACATIRPVTWSAA
jgi:hypothetical protein